MIKDRVDSKIVDAVFALEEVKNISGQDSLIICNEKLIPRQIARIFFKLDWSTGWELNPQSQGIPQVRPLSQWGMTLFR